MARSHTDAGEARAGAAPGAGGTGFASGARVLTRRGETLVDRINEGDEVLSASGRWERIAAVEVGPCAEVVRIRRDAFGAGEPHRDVSVGAAQMLAVRGALCPAGSLVDHSGVHPERRSEARFFRFALHRAGSAIVDGLAASLPGDGRAEPHPVRARPRGTPARRLVPAGS